MASLKACPAPIKRNSSFQIISPSLPKLSHLTFFPLLSSSTCFPFNIASLPYFSIILHAHERANNRGQIFFYLLARCDGGAHGPEAHSS